MAADEPIAAAPVARSSTTASVGLLLARLPLGAYFAIAGIEKFRMGIDTFVNAFLPNATKFMPENGARMFLTALPYAEITLGLLLIFGVLTRVAAGLVALLLISFTLGATGVSGNLGPGVQLPFHPNLIYLGNALALMLCGPGWISIDGVLFRPRRRRVIVTEDDRRVDEP
jgi:uncharacterized membrane protein YphA (DoxX/SURF4 family)